MKKNINGLDITISISQEKLHQSSENSYFDISFVDDGNPQNYTNLHVGFSKTYLDSSPNSVDINFDTIINSEIEKFLKEIGDRIFGDSDYFVYYSYNGVITNKKFSPFI